MLRTSVRFYEMGVSLRMGGGGKFIKVMIFCYFFFSRVFVSFFELKEELFTMHILQIRRDFTSPLGARKYDHCKSFETLFNKTEVTEVGLTFWSILLQLEPRKRFLQFTQASHRVHEL